MNNVIPLTRLPSGRKATIERVEGRADHVHRLQEIGLRPGVVVEMVKPGSPCIIRLAGGKLCYRGANGSDVYVRVGA